MDYVIGLVLTAYEEKEAKKKYKPLSSAKAAIKRKRGLSDKRANLNKMAKVIR